MPIRNSLLSAFLVSISINLAAFAEEMWVPDQVMVKFSVSVDLDGAKTLLDSETFNVVEGLFTSLDIFLVQITDTSFDAPDAVDSLEKLPSIEWAQLDYLLEPFYTPNDPDFSLQWHLSHADGYDIDMEEAWDVTTNGKKDFYNVNTVVAVLGYGFNGGSIPEIANNLWTNPTEHADGIDNDGNNYPDDFWGWDVCNDDNTIEPWPYSNHEAEIAYVIGAGTNNGLFMAGTVWDANIMRIKTWDTGGNNYVNASRLIAAADYMYECRNRANQTLGYHSANVVAANLSYGRPRQSCNDGNWPALRAALTQLGNVGVIWVNGVPNEYNYYIDGANAVTPPDCNNDNLIVVTGHNQSGTVIHARSAEHIHLAAPAINIPIPVYIPGYDFHTQGLEGTSYAAPQVVATIALLTSAPIPALAYARTVLSPHQSMLLIKNLILDNVHPEGWGYVSTGGRLNANNALRAAMDYYDEARDYDDFRVADATATYPSSSTNIVMDYWNQTYRVFDDNDNVFYAWDAISPTEAPNRQYLLSKPRDTDPVSVQGGGCYPSIAVGGLRETPDDYSKVYLAWVVNDPGSPADTFRFLEHSIAVAEAPNNNVISLVGQEWRSPNLRFGTALWDRSPISGLVAVGGYSNSATENLPALVVGFAGSNPRVWIAQAPRHNWMDKELWWDHSITSSLGQTITSVSAYRLDFSNDIFVAWTNTNNEVHFSRVSISNDILTEHQHTIVSSGLSGVTSMGNASICYSRFLDACFIAWDGHYNQTGRKDVFWIHGVANGSTIIWETPRILYGEDNCVDRSNPYIAPVNSGMSSVPNDVCPIGLIYDWFDQGEQINRVQVRGMTFDPSAPQDDTSWDWSPVYHTAFARSGSLTERRVPNLSAPQTRYKLCYTGFNPVDSQHQVISYLSYLYNSQSTPSTIDPVDPLVVSSEVRLPLPYILDRDLIVENGGNVIFERNPAICSSALTPEISALRPDIRIEVESGGTLNIQGSSGNLIKLKAQNVNGTWGGITVKPGGSLFMDYVEMKDCDSVCIYTDAPQQISISNCVLYGNKMVANAPVLRLWNNPSKTQYVSNTVVKDVPNGVGFYPWNCDLEFDNVTIEDCDVVNSYIKSVTGNFRNCTFSGRASQYGLMFYSTGNTPNFQCCTINDVSPLSGSYANMIYAWSGTAPSFGYTGSTQGVSNSFTDSCAYMMRMSDSGVKPVIANTGSGVGGRNDWIQKMATGKYIYWGGTYPKPLTPYFVKEQYWNKKPVSVSDFYPADASYFTFGGEPSNPWELCGGAMSGIADRGSERGLGLDDVQDVFDSLFSVAMSLEIEREYESSQPIFRQIAAESDDYDLVWLAMTHAASNQRFLQDESDGNWIALMIDSLVTAAPDSMQYETGVAGERLKGSHHLSLEEYNAAIDVLADLLETGLTETDSLLVSIELLNVYVAAGLVEYDGSLDNVNASERIPHELRVATIDDAWLVEQDIMARLASIEDAGIHTNSAPLPTQFRLYQNYPNPFNPTTQIEFDLPEAVRVSLKVFNTLGQEVVTVNDALYPAGHHVVTWNGKSNAGLDVATGLYIYQIKAGSFTDTKKMILMR